MRPDKPAKTVKRAKRLRSNLSLPEAMLWRLLKASPGGHKFRKQHPAGPYDLDFFCARANLAIEVDGISHDMGNRPQRDDARTAWLLAHRIDTLRIAARDVLADVVSVADMIVAVVEERKAMFGKAPPSVASATATSPTHVIGEDRHSDGGAK